MKKLKWYGRRSRSYSYAKIYISIVCCFIFYISLAFVVAASNRVGVLDALLYTVCFATAQHIIVRVVIDNKKK